MVNDSTSYSSTSVYTKNYHSPTIICFLAKLNNLMSRKCGPQSLTIQSTNDVATSIPSTTTTMECNDTTCRCSYICDNYYLVHNIGPMKCYVGNLILLVKMICLANKN